MKKICLIAGAIILLIAAGFIFYNSKTTDDADDSAEFIEALATMARMTRCIARSSMTRALYGMKICSQKRNF
jgi:uncharacterized protein YxeA